MVNSQVTNEVGYLSAMEETRHTSRRRTFRSTKDGNSSTNW